MIDGYWKEMIWQGPMYLVFSIGVFVAGWYTYDWAKGEGGLQDIKIVCCLALFPLMGLSLLIMPLLWPLRLRRCQYTLTTHRLIIRQPGLLIFLPTTREVGPGDAGAVRLKCIWTWLPERTGDIVYGEALGGQIVIERIPQAEEVVKLIHNTLLPNPGNL
jgi:hypothetical protein